MKNLKRSTLALSILIALLAVTGCKENLKITTKDKDNWPYELCVKGVVYYSFGHGKAPAFKADGSLYTCDS